MPQEHMTVEGIIQRAIRFEEDAYDFYTGASEMVKLSHVRDMLNELAGEEVKHKEKLEGLLAGDTEQIVAAKQRQKIQDLKLADYLVAPPLDEGATIQDVLMTAMQREKNSHEFYNLMAGMSASGSARDIFQFLAQEELGHKNKVEVLYDDIIYKEF
ncbi:MAG: ferritin family protein [Anaerolineae bacterium]|nr:ferritin family protein [Anaerolineae bacterium]